MEITALKQRGEYNDDIKLLTGTYKFMNYQVNVKGSYSLKNIEYYADYDLYSTILRNHSDKETYEEFCKILNLILDNINLYFVEFKIQNLDGTKLKFVPNQEFNFKDFRKIFDRTKTEYCKIDLILWSNNRFIESSCNYWFNKKKNIDKDVIKEIDENISLLKKENNYYKVLKREYLKCTIKGDTNKTKLLIDVFNSDLGKIYIKINNIDAIDKILEFYNDPLTKKRVEINIDEIKYPQNYKKFYNEEFKKLNKSAKRIYNDVFKP